jgi:hypothetical protein
MNKIIKISFYISILLLIFFFFIEGLYIISNLMNHNSIMFGIFIPIVAGLTVYLGSKILNKILNLFKK